MTITLITGGNRGLGFETARRLKEAGHKIYIGARNAESGKESASKLGVESLQLDVTKSQSIEAAVEALQKREGKLDILINNCGVAGDMKPVEETTPEDVAAVYETNVFGVVRMTKAFLPLLKKSEAPSVINISSGLGSFTMVQDPANVEYSYNNLPYNSSKSALNMITLQYAKAMPDIRFNIVDPGYTATDMNHHSGHQTVEEGTDAVVKVAMTGKGGPTGTYTNRHGTEGW